MMQALFSHAESLFAVLWPVVTSQFFLGVFTMQAISVFNSTVSSSIALLFTFVKDSIWARICVTVWIVKDSPLYAAVRNSLKKDTDLNQSSLQFAACEDSDIVYKDGRDACRWITFRERSIYVSYDKGRSLELSAFAWNFSIIKEFLKAVVDGAQAIAAEKKRLDVEIAAQYKGAELRRSIPRRLTSAVFLPRGLMLQIIKRIELFRSQRDYYAFNNVPYHLGILLHGVPGSGKTSLVKAIASRFNLDIVVAPQLEYLRNVSGKTHQLRIVLLEDIDCMLPNPKQEAIKMEEPGALLRLRQRDEQSANFSHLLNFIDGVAAEQGQIIIMTTNHVELLDPALIRPGRVDMSIGFGYVCEEQLARAIDRFYFCKTPRQLSKEDNDAIEHKMAEPRRSNACARKMISLLARDGKRIAMSAVTQHFLAHQQSFDLALANLHTLVPTDGTRHGTDESATLTTL